MRIATIAIGLLLAAGIAGSAFAQEYVQGYYRRDGTYVQGYYRSSPNDTVQDNYSFKGNVNPYTGKTGTDEYTHDRTSPYYSGPDSQGRTGHDGSSSSDDSDDDQ